MKFRKKPIVIDKTGKYYIRTLEGLMVAFRKLNQMSDKIPLGTYISILTEEGFTVALAEHDREIIKLIDEMINPLNEALTCEMERMGDLVIIGELSARIEVLTELKQKLGVEK